MTILSHHAYWGIPRVTACMSRPLIAKRIDDLEALFDGSTTREEMEALRDELRYRDRPRAVRLLARVQEKLGSWHQRSAASDPPPADTERNSVNAEALPDAPAVDGDAARRMKSAPYVAMLYSPAGIGTETISLGAALGGELAARALSKFSVRKARSVRSNRDGREAEHPILCFAFEKNCMNCYYPHVTNAQARRSFIIE